MTAATKTRRVDKIKALLDRLLAMFQSAFHPGCTLQWMKQWWGSRLGLDVTSIVQ